MRTVLIPLLIMANIANMFAGNNRYRLTLRDNPATSIVIGWNQVSGSSPVVYYGTTDHGTNWSAYPSSKAPNRAVSYKGMNNNFARLSGLQPNTAYYFVIRDSEGTSSRFWFKTAPDVNTERLSFIAGGDSRNNRTPRQNANKLVAKLKPHAVLFGGDMTSSGTNSQWQDWFQDWQLTTGTDGRMIPIIAARGNHESSNGMIEDLFDVPNSNVYYAITFGNNLIRTYTLNSEISISGSQTSWLSSDLSNNAGTIWKMAQYHKPMRPHVSSKSEGTSQYSNWAQLFKDNGVKVVVECDAHTVKTTWPVVPSTSSGSDEGFVRNDAEGTVYVGEGCWGAPLRNNNDAKAWTRNSGMFNQFKWIFVDAQKIEIRTIKVDNADQVETVNDNNIFAAPSNLDIWNPSNGSVVTLTNNGTPPAVSLTSPLGGSSYSSGDQIALSASASDTDGSISKVEFFVNGNKVGEDATAPYSVNYTIPADGVYSIYTDATDNDNNTTSSNTRSITAGVVSVSTSSRISSGNDDVEEEYDGIMYTTSSDLELVADGSRGNQTIGLRFTGLNIPQGATITNAYIQFTVDETNTGTTNLTIRAEDTDDAAAFSTSSYNVSNRTKTSASVNWSPAAWNSVRAAGADQRTPDMKNIIQEVVNRSGFTTASDVVIIIQGTGERTAESYNGTSSSAPILYVDYTTGSGSGPTNEVPTVSFTNPSEGEQFVGLNSISLSANASDSDGSISKVEFYIDGSYVGEDASYPFSINWTPSAYGNYSVEARAIDNDNAVSSDFNNFIVEQASQQPYTFEVRISSGRNDVEERSNGDIYINSSDLELVYDRYQSAGNQTIGLRFLGINIPKGATITNAYIQFTADETDTQTTNLEIKGEDTDDASSFGSGGYNVSNRTKTSASVNWSPAAWNTVGAATSNERTPDISLVIQEIVNRGGWSSGNDMVIIITGTGQRCAESYNGSSSKAPLIHIEYTTVSSSRTTKPLSVEMQETTTLLAPNPVLNLLSISSDASINKLTIVNTHGQIVYSEMISEKNSTVDMSSLPASIYVVLIETENGIIRRTITKQ